MHIHDYDPLLIAVGMLVFFLVMYFFIQYMINKEKKRQADIDESYRIEAEAEARANEGEETFATRSGSSAQNIQMNLGNGKITSKDGSITNLTIWDDLNIKQNDGIIFGGKRFKVVTPTAWYVKLQSWSDDPQDFSAVEVNQLIDQGEYHILYGGKRYSPIALYTNPKFGPGDNWRLTEMRGFQGTSRNSNAQNKAHLPTNVINSSGKFSINRLDEVDGSGFWTIELKPKGDNDGKVVIYQ